MTDCGRVLPPLHPRTKVIRICCLSHWIVEIKESARMCWYTSAIPALKKWRQENEEFKVAMSYTPSLKPTSTTRDSPSKKCIREMSALAHVHKLCSREAKARGSIVLGQFIGLYSKALFKRSVRKSSWTMGSQGFIVFCEGEKDNCYYQTAQVRLNLKCMVPKKRLCELAAK